MSIKITVWKALDEFETIATIVSRVIAPKRAQKLHAVNLSWFRVAILWRPERM
jgi:hypothetical protein